jgi:hypothetical protein
MAGPRPQSPGRRPRPPPAAMTHQQDPRAHQPISQPIDSPRARAHRPPHRPPRPTHTRFVHQVTRVTSHHRTAALEYDAMRTSSLVVARCICGHSLVVHSVRQCHWPGCKCNNFEPLPPPPAVDDPTHEPPTAQAPPPRASLRMSKHLGKGLPDMGHCGGTQSGGPLVTMTFGEQRDRTPMVPCHCGHSADRHLYCGDHLCIEHGCKCPGFSAVDPSQWAPPRREPVVDDEHLPEHCRCGHTRAAYCARYCHWPGCRCETFQLAPTPIGPFQNHKRP